MAGIVFYFEDNDTDVWSGRRVDLDAWNYAAKAAGDIDHMIVVNRTDQKLQSPDRAIDFQECSSMPMIGGRAVNMVTPWSATPSSVSLWDFDHQTDWYVFGPASGQHELSVDTVHIPQAGMGALHSVHVASVVMMHRYGVLNS